MDFKEKEKRNKIARSKYEKMFKKKRDVAKELDMHTTDFSAFLSGSKIFGGKTLQRIEDYLNDIRG